MRSQTILIGAGAVLAAATIFTPMSENSQASAQTSASRSYPSNAQCWAGQRGDQAYITACKIGVERHCPNATSDAAKGYYLRSTPSCIPLTPQEIAKYKAEQARKAKFEADVQAEIGRLGKHREAEIRRRLELRERAMAARPQAPQPAATGKSAYQQEMDEALAKRRAEDREKQRRCIARRSNRSPAQVTDAEIDRATTSCQ